ncbi:MAG: bifunctional diaminohydroxyphosphoribosylaminopyrimidine deaminase/5-amino-6-(5-phosphoribosylamino)uracil reductase RibD [Lachnospiraceae bacterium]|nr:bifunctional diaminohydroxyphosphoribosylaminopyrimidine deaminase/5-amino-6-(5-phosphoribosylamino)uracil reductase RibD [Lachnospiraceae bacterium]
MEEEKYMKRAIELAYRGEGFTNPNPMVGAVIVRDGRIIGEGYHRRYGDLHAERDALSGLTEDAQGATLYVTLEPCCHHGKQPPCTGAIIDNGIGKVVIGSRDPNPLVAGKGVKILREAGIEVVEDFLMDECDAINPVFFKYITTKQPYVVLKYAMTMDGKIATKAGASKWITGEESRSEVQKMRHRYMAIMAGIGTVLADDPMLNVRLEGLKSPIRIIADSGLRIPLGSNIVKTAGEYRTIVAYCEADTDIAHREGSGPKEDACIDKTEELKKAGVELVKTPSENGHVDVAYLMNYLGGQGIDSVLVEGGGTLNYSLIRAGLVDRVDMFIAPKIFGGLDARTPVEGTGIAGVDEAVGYVLKEVTRYGEDIRLSYSKSIKK